MSAPHVSWALRVRKLKPAQRLVLCAIAERANADLACWPSISVIAADIELTERAVYLAVDYLANERNLIRKVTGDERDELLARGGFRGHPQVNVYQLVKNEIPNCRKVNGYTPEHSSPLPLNTVHPEHSSPLNTVQNTPELSSPESLIESPIEKGSVLRTAQAASPPCVEAPKAVEILFTEGLQTLRHLVGRSDRGCRSLLGQWRKVTRDDCAQVVAAIRQAADVHPADPVAFITGALKPKPQRETFEQMRERVLASFDVAGTA